MWSQDNNRGQTFFDLITVGHLAIDLISSPRIISPKQRLGGPPAYVSLSAVKLDAKVSVVSKVGQDFPEDYAKWLRLNGVDLSGLKRAEDSLTTKFTLKYQRNWKRKLQLKARAPSMLASEIPDSLHAKAIHIAPIVNELPEAMVTKLRKSAEILSLDPQGFVRGFDSLGNVRPKRWLGKSVLELIDIYKSSQDEIKAVTGTSEIQLAAKKIRDYGAKIVIITRSVRGSTLFFGDSFHHIPAYQPSAVLDPTGAGDAFIGAFLAEHIRGKGALWSACVGSAAASFVVEGIGPEKFGGREEAYERAEEIYEKQSKK